jgi:hypothetical protein
LDVAIASAVEFLNLRAQERIPPLDAAVPAQRASPTNPGFAKDGAW